MLAHPKGVVPKPALRAVKTLAVILVVLIALIQFPLWSGKGSWSRVWALEREIHAQRDTNAKLQARNAALDAEVRDLKHGYDAIEERARNELGMIKDNEIFFQVVDSTPQAPASGKK